LTGMCAGCPEILAWLGGNPVPTDGADGKQPACSGRQGLQVTIETRFITVESNFLEEIGVDLDMQLGVENAQAGSASYAPVAPTQDAVQSFLSVLTGCEDVKLNVFALQSLASPAGEVGAGWTLLGSFLDDTQLGVLIRAIEQDQKTNILQAPSLTVQNGQAAHISIGDEIRVVSELQPDVATGLMQVDPLIAVVITGPALTIRPVISSDRRYVTLEIRPEIGVVFNTPDVQVETGDGSVAADRPLIRTSSVRTTVSVNDGQTLLLGGLIQDAETRGNGVLPFLGNIPIIGRAFDNRQYVTEETELLVLVTPEIVDVE